MSIPMPKPSAFDPQRLNATKWMESVTAYGGKYAVLTVQAGCGFTLWPTKSKMPDGSTYPYSIANSPLLKNRDVLREFVDAARAAGIKPGIYYILNNNKFLRCAACKDGSNEPTFKKGSVAVTGEQYRSIVLAQLAEIWGSYGELTELWFDGGTVDTKLAPQVTALLSKLQPKAVCFQGPTKAQGIRWPGSESGNAPEPNWSAANSSVDFGGGDPNGPAFAPTESDVTLAANGQWYWVPGQVLKTLPALISIYERTIGHNANLLLDFSPDYSGALPTESVAQYAAFGAWVKGCYGAANSLKTNWTAATKLSAGQSVTVALSPAASTSRVVLQEDQTKGQRIRSFRVEWAGADGVFKPLAVETSSGLTTTLESLGHKRIVPLNATTVSTLRLTMLESVGTAVIRFVGAQGSNGCVVPPSPPQPPCLLTHNYAFTGNAFGPAVTGKSATECCSLCRAKSGCVAFVRRSSGACTLFQSLGGGGVEQGTMSGSPTHSEATSARAFKADAFAAEESKASQRKHMMKHDDALERFPPPNLPSFVKNVHIVSLTHLDVGGYGPTGTCEDDCKWASDVCNTYFDRYLPTAVDTAEALKSARIQRSSTSPHGKCPPGRGEGHEPAGWYDCAGYRRGFGPKECKAVGCCVNEARYANVSKYPNTSKSWEGWCFPDHSNDPNLNVSFVYFSHPWLVQEYFNGSAGCGRDVSTRNASALAKVEAAVRAGEISWHAKPFTSIHELNHPDVFQWSLNISRELSARFGVKHGRSAAKATDIPGVSIGIVPILARAGVKALHLGTNGMGNQIFPVNITGRPQGNATHKPHFKNAGRVTNDPYSQVFRWQHPATGDEILMLMEQHYGSKIEVPGFDQVLRFQITGDNQGPPKPEAVRQFWAQMHKEYPNATLHASTLDDFADELWKVKDDLLPIVTQEIGNAWLPQMGTDPWRFRSLREVGRMRSEWLADGRLVWNDRDLHDYSSGLLLPVEHNFGMQTKKVLNVGNGTGSHWHRLYWTNSEFHKRMSKADGDLVGFPGLQYYDDERDRYVFPRPARKGASSGYKAFVAHVNATLKELAVVPSLSTMVTSGRLIEIDVTDSKAMMLQNDKLSLKFDSATGAITSLVEKTSSGSREWVAKGDSLAEFVYITYTQKADIDPYIDQFTPGHPTTEEDMKVWPWSKPGMDLAIEADPAMPPLANCSKAWPVSLQKAWKSDTTMLLQLALPVQAVKLFGGMSEIVLNVTLPSGDESTVDVALTWKDKTATRLAESSWLSFVPSVPRPTKGWRLDVLGSPVDPLSVAYNGSRHLHAIYRGVCYDDTVDGSIAGPAPVRLALESLDVPLVAPGDAAHLIDFDNKLPDLTGGFHFNLHNNAGWDQSAPQWYGRDAAFRFKLNLNAPRGCWPKQKTDDDASSTKTGPPSILFIMADDLGYGDISSYPNPSDRRLHTPHIAALASKGMQFTDAYAGYSVCAPSRRTLMAGYHSGHFDPHGNGGVAILSPRSVTVAKLLRSAKKYRTRLVGKWGLDGSYKVPGGMPPTQGFPTLQGFDSFYGQSDQWQCHDFFPPFMYNGTANLTVAKNRGASNASCGHDYNKCAWTGDLWTTDAIDWITESAKEAAPWFLYLAYTSPHAGAVGSIELNGVPAPRVSVGPYAKKSWPKVEIDFATAVTAIDTAVGKVVSAVEATGQSSNTIIFFASDNGAHQEGGHDHRFFNSSGYLNGFKRCIFDGGHRAAFIVRWDGHIAPAQVSSHQLSFVDFLPTAAELAGVPATALPPKIDGHSFVPTLLGKPQDQPKFIYHDFVRPIDAAVRHAAFGQNIRMGKWSGVAACSTPPCRIADSNTTFFLFDMDVDQAQKHDVSADEKNADVVKQLNEIMVQQYEHSWDPAMPPPDKHIKTTPKTSSTAAI